MPLFEYFVKDPKGKDQHGTQEASDLNSMVTALRSQGYIIIRIAEAKKQSDFVKGLVGPSKSEGKSGSIKIDDLVIFSRQMATLVAAGIPIVQALDILAEQSEKAKLKSILRDIHREVQGGKSFSEALVKHKKIFSDLFINLIKAGETSGSLEEILDRLASYLEKTSALQKKVKSALMYPSTVSVMAFLITYGMMAGVIPKFATMFQGLNAKLPAPTVFLITLSNFLAAYWYVVFGGIFFVIVATRQILHTPAGKLAWDSLTLRLPIFGPIFIKVAVSKFARTLATLVRSGVPILSALEIVSKSSGNKRLEIVIKSVMESVKKGDTISLPLGKSGVFPQMVVRMIGIGEETGELEEMLIKIADFYDTEVDAAVDGLTSLIEPLVIAFLGIVIGGIVIAMFLPILTLSGQLK
jgi:type IV pilus assembly protein PilC